MRNRIFLALDVVLTVVTVLLAYTARFEGWEWWSVWGPQAIGFTVVAVPIKILVFWQVGMYRRLWRYASVGDLELLLVACLLSAAAVSLMGALILPMFGLLSGRVPLSVLVLDAALTPAVVALPRFVFRAWARRDRGRISGRVNGSSRRALIAGAGAAGGMIAKELLENPQLGISPVGFVDDDPTKHGHRLHGIRVLGPLSALPRVVERNNIGEVIIAMPSAPGKVVREVMQRASEAGVKTRTVPGIYEILSGSKSVSALRQVEIQDLLRREPIHTNLEEVSSLVTGKTILVTGAGGSIGSELCRQLAQLRPEKIVALGRGENSIFELLEELKSSFPHLEVKPAIVDVRDEIRLRSVFEAQRPFSVFHAAAHKHVPLMEASVDEAILNNVSGARNVAELSAVMDVEHLVLISTDKAVRPTSIMGATKRIAEEIVHCVAEREGRKYVSVRFGNVLGSRGSVVPTFMRQIAAGGPIMITDAEMRRYFMTIPEAVQLVLQASALGLGGEVFVLDMGEPVKIVDLAHDLVRLSGLQVGTDVEIQFTGARPGEKLYEELFFGIDVAVPTVHPKILRARESRSVPELEARVDALIDAARRRESDAGLRMMVHALVPEYANGAVGSPAVVVAGMADVVPLSEATRVRQGGRRTTRAEVSGSPPDAQIASLG